MQDDPSAPAVFHIDVGSSKDDDVRTGNFVEFKVFVFGSVEKLRLLILFALLPHPLRSPFVASYTLSYPRRYECFEFSNN